MDQGSEPMELKADLDASRRDAIALREAFRACLMLPRSERNRAVGEAWRTHGIPVRDRVRAIPPDAVMTAEASAHVRIYEAMLRFHNDAMAGYQGLVRGKASPLDSGLQSGFAPELDSLLSL